MDKSSLKEVILAVTYQCNSRCRMCGIWKKTDPQRINPEMVKKLPGNLKDINITGGEPFLYDGLVEVVGILVSASPRASLIISSNGFATGLIASKMKEIIKIKPDAGVAISIDGLGERHDQVRGVEGGFGKAMATIDELKKIGVKKLRLSFTLGDYNIDQLAPVYRLAEKLSIELSLTLVHSSAQYFSTRNFITKKEEMLEVLDALIKKELSSGKIKKWLRAYYAHGMKYFINNQTRLLPDYSGLYGVFVDPDGNIFPSDISEKKLGNVSDFDFNASRSEIAKNEKPSWMICTARTAIRKHWLRAGFWIFMNKLKNL